MKLIAIAMLTLLLGACASKEQKPEETAAPAAPAAAAPAETVVPTPEPIMPAPGTTDAKAKKATSKKKAKKAQ